jgi:hypothetical protein
MVRNATADALVGVWLFASAFVFPATYLFFVNNLTAGGIVAIIAFFGPFANPFLAWLPAVIGMWVAISPVALDFTQHFAATWSNVIAGLVIMVLSMRSWWLTKDERGTGIPDRGQ